MNAPAARIAAALRPPTCAVSGHGLPLALILALVLVLRLALMSAAGAGLHVDEAQYWLWSRDLQWGYHSKPPGIAALIALSTTLWGDSGVGVRALAMACHPLAAACLWRLAHDITAATPPIACGTAPVTGPTAAARQAGHWTLALFLCSPLSGLLGLVATTDAPLLLCWSAALLALWHLVQGRPGSPARRAAGPALALAVGAGLLSKYTMAAFLPGALVWAAWAGGRAACARVALALGAALLLFVPHLLWNLGSDLATWQHTVASTVDVAPPAGRGPLRRVAEALAAQWLIFGPVAGTLGLVGAWRAIGSRRHQARPRPRFGAGTALWLASAAPLAAAGLAMALRGRFEVNWIAPAHLLAALALGPLLAAAAPARRRRAALGLGLQALLVIGLAALPAAVQAWRPGQFPPPALDVWARMRGWDTALERLRTAGSVARLAGARPVLVGSDRHVLAHAGWQWRTLRPVLAAADPDGRPEHHFERVCPWQRALRAGDSALLLSQGPPPERWARAFDRITPLAQARVPRSAGRLLGLTLARGEGFRPAAAVDDPRLLPTPDDLRSCP